jgi:hypothetical protein
MKNRRAAMKFFGHHNKDDLMIAVIAGKRGGSYDPVSSVGNAQPPEVREKQTPHQKAQWCADVRPEPQPGAELTCPLPEGLRKPRM